MKVVLHGWEAKDKCVWRQRERETVRASFSDRLLTNASICWKCLATVVRVRTQGVDEQPQVESKDASSEKSE